MYQYGRVASSRRNLGLSCWFATAAVIALGSPLGCAVYEPSAQPGDDVAGLQSDAGATSDLPEGGAGGLGGSGRAGSDSSSAGARMMAAGGESGGSYAGGAGGSTTGHAGAASSAGAGGTGSVSGGAGASGASTYAGSANGGSASGGSTSGGAANTAGGGSAGSSTTAAVDLAQGKPATASSEQVGNEAPKGNDASSSTRWCALHGTFPQWWRVDLGTKHKLNDFSVKFEHGERKYSYKIETSNDDSVYTLQSTISGTGDVQSDTFASGVSARYVRITVTSADPYVSGTTSYPTWASFWNFSVTGW